jgi:hypothetical protein
MLLTGDLMVVGASPSPKRRGMEKPSHHPNISKYHLIITYQNITTPFREVLH